ncbi:Bud site selection protein, Revert to axial protein 1 [Coemansia sp. RSA 1939]|nr:Bud site selection protein, Revert to axial protein 1 [Coemansia sp. RSA 1939]
MSSKLQRKHHQNGQRPDSSPFLPPAYPSATTHEASPYSSGLAASVGPGASEVTVQGSHGVNNADALLSAGRHFADEKNARDRSAASSAASSAFQQGTYDERAPSNTSSMESLPANNYPSSRSKDGRGRATDSPAGAGGAAATLADDVREADMVHHPSAGFTGYNNYHGMVSQQAVGHDAVGDQLLITTSLLDPHPIIVPPPGSRLAFPGANSREMTHTFRSLPSLEDTLLRNAREPLCLYNYWQYLVDVECRPEELEFWLSLSDYEVLYRRYANLRSPSIGPMSGENAYDGRSHVRTLGPTGKRLRYGRVESGALGSQNVNDPMAAGAKLSMVKRKSGPVDNLDTEAQELDMYLATLSYQTALAAKTSICHTHRQCNTAHRPFTSAHAASRPTLDAPAPLRRHSGLRGFFSRIFSGEPGMREGTAALATASRNGPASETQEAPLLASHTGGEPKEDLVDAPTEEEMRRAAERLYFHYFLPGAPAELYISPQMRDEIGLRVERDNRLDADLFAPAKRHVYEAMHSESYLRFLRERLYHNITRGTAAPRIALGLSLIFVALVFQFSLVFLDVKPKGWRWLPLAALWPGFAYAFAGVSRLDPFFALLGRYEATAWKLERVRDPAIHDRHLKRGTLHLIFAAAVAALISLVLFLVPGHHL